MINGIKWKRSNNGWKGILFWAKLCLRLRHVPLGCKSVSRRMAMGQSCPIAMRRGPLGLRHCIRNHNNRGFCQVRRSCNVPTRSLKMDSIYPFRAFVRFLLPATPMLLHRPLTS